MFHRDTARSTRPRGAAVGFLYEDLLHTTRGGQKDLDRNFQNRPDSALRLFRYLHPAATRARPQNRAPASALRTPGRATSLKMRALVVAMVLASANSFAPSQKTRVTPHLATRLAPQAPLRVMPAMKTKSDSPLYTLGLPGFPSQAEKDMKRLQVRPYHCARLAPLALAQPFRMHGLLPHAHRPPWSPRLSLEPCAPAPLAPLASLEPPRFP